jgi:hypothetical protein
VKLRSPYDEPVKVPWLDDLLVNPGQAITVPDGLLPNFLASGWQPADKPTQAAADALAKASAGDAGGKED